MTIIQFKSGDARDFNAERRSINIAALKSNTARTAKNLIEPAKEEYKSEVVVDHSADPIKSMDDILMICDYLLKEERYRDYMLFVVGINFGLRASDLRMLRFGDLIDNSFTFKATFPVFEIKTRNTRKRKKNRYVSINDAVIEAVTLYLENTPGVCLSDYMFRSESAKDHNENKPLSRVSIDRILKGIASEMGLSMNMSTHTLRKTFCYWMMAKNNNSQRMLLLLQKMLNHSSPAQTLSYIGITDDEIADAYFSLNLGRKDDIEKMFGGNVIAFAKEAV